MKMINIDTISKDFKKNQYDLVKQHSESFNTSDGFRHVVMDNFLSLGICRALADEFPEVVGSPEKEPVQRAAHKHQVFKKGCNQIEKMGKYQQAFFQYFNSPEFLEILQKITGIPKLYSDVELFGGGLHQSPRGGKLNVHTDFNIHPTTKLHRRLNLILYLNEHWQPDWNGHLELWPDDMRAPIDIISPSICKAVLFETSELSFHGFSKPLNCPSDIARKSLALYYYSEWPEGIEVRPRTNWQLTPLQWSQLISEVAHLQANMKFSDEEIKDNLFKNYQSADIMTGINVLKSLKDSTNFAYPEKMDLIPKWQFYKDNNTIKTFSELSISKKNQLEITKEQFKSSGNDPWVIIENKEFLSSAIKSLWLKFELNTYTAPDNTQIFFDFGDGFSESYVGNIHSFLNEGQCIMNIKTNKPVHRIRIDPANRKGILNIKDIQIAFDA